MVYNAAINSTCAITNVDAGRLDILPESIVDFMIRGGDGRYYSPSMLIDIRKNQNTEYKTTLGTALEIAEEKGVEAPLLTFLYK